MSSVPRMGDPLPKMTGKRKKKAPLWLQQYYIPSEVTTEEMQQFELDERCVEIALGMYAQFLRREIRKELRKNRYCQNRDVNISVTLTPCPSHLFNELFQPIINSCDLKMKKHRTHNSLHNLVNRIVLFLSLIHISEPTRPY